jgi:hypothetical protein
VNGHEARSAASPQVACDRCSQGVMDTTNDHWLRLCRCECHSQQPELARTPTAVLDASVEEWVRHG